MTQSLDDSGTINPFLPSLLHLGLVRVARAFRDTFGTEILERALAEIQRENSAASHENLRVGRNEAEERSTDALQTRDGIRREGRVKCDRAKERLLLLPESLRKSILEAANGMDYAVRAWRIDHLFVGKKERVAFRWRPDGTIDRIETARQLVRDDSMDVTQRFWASCMYCFEESVLSLWAEMEASGKTEHIDTDDDSLLRCWVRWIRDEPRIPFSRAAVEYMDPPQQFSRTPIINFSSLFPLLKSKERRRFLNSLRHTTDEDFRVSLYIVTEVEKQKILTRHAMKLLILYLNWPFQSLFVETAKKIWHLIDEFTFKILANLILLYHQLRTDYDYGELFKCFWNSSPNHFKEATRVNRHLRRRIYLCLEGRRSEQRTNKRNIEQTA